MSAYEDVVSFLGEWGAFQKTVFFLLSASSIPNGYMGLAAVFLADTPPHHCRLQPENAGRNASELNQFIPLQEFEGKAALSSCTRYKQLNKSSTGTQNATEGCLNGWEFSSDRYTSTIVTEWNLVCEDAWKVPFATSALFFGMLTGTFISGPISDRFGRKLALFASLAMQIVFTLLQAASNRWELYCICYFLGGMGSTAKYNAAFVLGYELLGKSPRVVFSALGISLCYAVGCAALPLFAFFVRGWRMLLLALALLQLLCVPMWWFIPESPRWLLSHGRLQEAEAIVQAAAKRNGVLAPSVIFTLDDCTPLNGSNKKLQQLYLNLFKTKDIRNITVLNLIIWMVTAMTYSGVSLGIPNLDGNPYLNCAFSAATEMAAYAAAWFVMRCCMRRSSLFVMQLLCGFTLLVVQLIPSELSSVAVAVVMLGKLGTSAAFCFLYTYSTELLPTVVRNVGLGAASISGCIGSIVAPYITHMGEFNKYLPYILMGGLSVFVGFLGLLLPETKDTELPEHISQVKPLRCASVVRGENGVGSLSEQGPPRLTRAGKAPAPRGRLLLASQECGGSGPAF
ncbi:solute carrier family 22 member 4-like [Megalops cyprinoides]|uniref:solute carrier family 22 member 4-like n=1 Tax=Megalops cyprinoides TaxID=118141 RepID=UPI001863E742|nr:solute carrier family 22 member 4-like [Megalops cyprinoides]